MLESITKQHFPQKTTQKCQNYGIERYYSMKIEGKNAVLEALKSDITIDNLMVQKGENSQITRLAREAGAKVQYVDKAVLDKHSTTGKHQGYILFVSDFKYCEVSDIIQHPHPFVVILEEINDPHNFGSIIRVCECAGVDGIIIAKNRQVQVNETVARCSAGAVSHMKIARVTNIKNTIEQLQNAGIWVYCADMQGQNMHQTDLSGSIALVIGGEDRGISRLTKEKCDGTISISMSGKVNSLNASVACGILVYEAKRQREISKK